MARSSMLSFPALEVLKFTPEERSAAQIGPDGLTQDQRGRGRAKGTGGIIALVDRLYQAKMVTDTMAEYVPRLRERVCVEGREEMFVVIYVDRKRTVADLVSTDRVGEMLESVSFSAMYPECPPRAA